jgi:hypothetical protein
VDEVERSHALAASELRIATENVDAKEEERIAMNHEKEDTQDNVKYLIKFNEEISAKIDEMTEKMRTLKSE